MADTAGGAGAAVVNIDMSPVSEIVKVLKGDSKKIIQDIAIKLYANSEFDKSGKSAAQLADAAIERAVILAKKLGI